MTDMTMYCSCSLLIGCGGSSDIIHVTTGNPLGVYSMSVSGPSINFVDLYGFFHRLGCQLSAAALGGAHCGKVMVHDSKVSCKIMGYMFPDNTPKGGTHPPFFKRVHRMTVT